MSGMRSVQRREAILSLLAESDHPLSASALAGHFGVSRQIVVGDIALLRASGSDILSTPRGYLCSPISAGVVRTVACIHTPEEMGAELTAIVDAGGEVLDVSVEHPVYGQLTGALRLRSRYDVAEFLRRVAQEGARPLSDLTGGIHLHTIRCPDEGASRRVLEGLEALGFLLH